MTPSHDPFPKPETRLIRPGTGSIQAIIDREHLRQQRERQLATIIRTADITTIDQVAVIATGKNATLPGDTRRLRGIPAIGIGVTGAITGTIPGHMA